VGVHNNEHKLIISQGKREVKESVDKSYLFTGYLSILFLLEYHVLTLLYRVSFNNPKEIPYPWLKSNFKWMNFKDIENFIDLGNKTSYTYLSCGSIFNVSDTLKHTAMICMTLLLLRVCHIGHLRR